jgi:O-antigen/teichoic acid export membrane protein
MADRPISCGAAPLSEPGRVVLDRPAAVGDGAQAEPRPDLPISPFWSIFRLSVGDGLAKVLYFSAFVFMAQKLGVFGYGVLEFAIAIRTYLLLVADGGLDLWAVRESAKGKDVTKLIGRVVPLRLLLALAGYIAVNVLLLFIPDNPNLHKILPVFALTAFLQAVNLKWVFVGQRKMSGVAGGLVLCQLIFALGIFALVREPADIFWVPGVWLAGELAMVLYFWGLFLRTRQRFDFGFSLRGAARTLRPAVALGVTNTLSLLNFNLDSVLLGIMLGPAAVGWYGAAYKPVTALLALPLSYFSALFPTLSNSYSANRVDFCAMVARSVRLTSIFAMPLGIGGTLLAGPVIQILFGPDYLPSVGPMQVLSWSAVFVILRGSFRQALNAAGRFRLDFYCALAAFACNLCVNLLAVPRFGLIGAAWAALLSEGVWLCGSVYFVSRNVMPVGLAGILWRPATAALVMAGFLLAAGPLFWIARAMLAFLIYLAVLAVLREPEIGGLLRRLLPRRACANPAGGA